MKRILWVSRHQPLPRQLEELRRLFGEVEVKEDPRPFSSAEEIQFRYQMGTFDDIVVVAPLSVLDRLVKLGIKPLWAQMQQVTADQGEVQVSDRHYRFDRFRRVKAVVLEFEELE